MSKSVTVTVPATTANLGPGFDCIGAALTLYNRLEFSHLETSSSTEILRITVQGTEAEVERNASERLEEAGDPRDPGCLDHEGQLHASLQGQVPEAQRRVLRHLQAVLQVDRRHRWRHLRVPPPSFGAGP